MFTKKFNITKNWIHIISLSCNPVPPEKYGGIELVIAHLCEGLAHRNAKVKCYSPGELDIEGVDHVQTLPTPSLHIREGGKPNTIEHLEAVKFALEENLSLGDIVVFNHADHYRYLKKKLNFLILIKARFYEVAHWIDAGLQKNIIYPSLHLKQDIGKPGFVIPHGEKLLFNNQPQKQREDYLFFAGRITKDKGVDIALEACKKLNIPLVLAGPLNDKTFAETILNDRSVKYLGELTYAELFEHYCTCKALVYMTQYTEPFGLSVIEAMAAGAPVITTGLGGTGETIEIGKTGFIAKTADDIVKAYAHLADLNPERSIMRAKNYTLDVMADNYLALFNPTRSK
jgi:glycosyltransferase involved in cell wall biosynthesis